MNTEVAVLKPKSQPRQNTTYTEEMRKIAYTQFKALAKKHIRLPFEQYHL